MKEIRVLAKNVGLLAVGQFGTKLLSFFLVPLYTYVLTTEEYGTFDFFLSTVMLLVPVLTANVCDAALRFPLDKRGNLNEIFSVCSFHFIASCLLGCVLTGLNQFLGIVKIITDYPLVFFTLFVSNSLNGILNYFARGVEKVKEVAISGVICTIVMISLNILFLLPMKLGLTGFFAANIIGTFAQSLYLFIAIKGWHYIQQYKMDKHLHKDMLDYSKPMILNNISWWINGVSNRYVITYFCGLVANGVFSVSYKIPSILMIFQNIFNQAWTLSAVHEFDKNDKNGFFSKMYMSYNVSMIIACSVLIILSKPIAYFLYSKDFYQAWAYVPFLLISSVFGALSGYIGGIYSATKDTKSFAKTSVIGAVVSIVATLLLVWKIGAMGAAIASVISYGIIWASRLFILKKHLKLKITLLRDIGCYLVMVIQACILLLLENNLELYIIESLLLAFILYMQKNFLFVIVKKIIKKETK
jgi:O-antigen/teichoic acid export membrane protein